jgi:hypothetical protein
MVVGGITSIWDGKTSNSPPMQHRVDPKQFAYDIQRSEDLDELGWTRIRVVKENRPADVLRLLDHAWHSKLRGDREIS